MMRERLKVGSSISVTERISEETIAAFIRLSGDAAPLHVDDGFARSQGFDGRLVHGALLVALLSRFVGMELPGPRSLWLKCDISFHNPCYAPVTIRIHGAITHISEATDALALAVTITDERDRHIATARTMHKMLGT